MQRLTLGVVAALALVALGTDIAGEVIEAVVVRTHAADGSVKDGTNPATRERIGLT